MTEKIQQHKPKYDGRIIPVMRNNDFDGSIAPSNVEYHENTMSLALFEAARTRIGEVVRLTPNQILALPSEPEKMLAAYAGLIREQAEHFKHLPGFIVGRQPTNTLCDLVHLNVSQRLKFVDVDSSNLIYTMEVKFNPEGSPVFSYNEPPHPDCVDHVLTALMQPDFSDKSKPAIPYAGLCYLLELGMPLATVQDFACPYRSEKGIVDSGDPTDDKRLREILRDELAEIASLKLIGEHEDLAVYIRPDDWYASIPNSPFLVVDRFENPFCFSEGDMGLRAFEIHDRRHDIMEAVGETTYNVIQDCAYKHLKEESSTGN